MPGFRPKGQSDDEIHAEACEIIKAASKRLQDQFKQLNQTWVCTDPAEMDSGSNPKFGRDRPFYFGISVTDLQTSYMQSSAWLMYRFKDKKLILAVRDKSQQVPERELPIGYNRDCGRWMHKNNPILDMHEAFDTALAESFEVNPVFRTAI